MDPHLTIVRAWDRNYVPSEKEAYYEARINGYIFSQDIGSLSKYELEQIASHPPSTDLKNYKHYRNMSLDELKEEFPAVVDIIGDKTVTYEDLFYYATRGWIPEYDNLSPKIERWNTYNDLSNVGKSLINLIYNNREGYINSLPHPLEQIILAYDSNMDDENVIRGIAERIDIVLPDDEYPQDSFYDILLTKIEKEYPYQNYAN
jgi:hypothetical protein